VLIAKSKVFWEYVYRACTETVVIVVVDDVLRTKVATQTDFVSRRCFRPGLPEAKRAFRISGDGFL